MSVTQMEVRQVTREALFVSKSSVLGLANIEDVTVVRDGIFAHIFNIETAGEQDNFKFKYCPRPGYFGHEVMKLREEYLRAMQQDQLLR